MSTWRSDAELLGIEQSVLVKTFQMGPQEMHIRQFRALYDAGRLDERASRDEEVARLRAELETAQANYRFMVERAAAEKLDGYRELGRRAAAAENECDRLRRELDAERAKVAALQKGKRK